MTPDEIQEAYPEEWARAQKDRFSHRYPRAESYHDLSVRLEPVIFNLEREQSDVLIIGHASVLRCLFAYLKGLAPASVLLSRCPLGHSIVILALTGTYRSLIYKEETASRYVFTLSCRPLTK